MEPENFSEKEDDYEVTQWRLENQQNEGIFPLNVMVFFPNAVELSEKLRELS
jgi:hypothetical protein